MVYIRLKCGFSYYDRDIIRMDNSTQHRRRQHHHCAFGVLCPTAAAVAAAASASVAATAKPQLPPRRVARLVRLCVCHAAQRPASTNEAFAIQLFIVSVRLLVRQAAQRTLSFVRLCALLVRRRRPPMLLP